MRRSAHTLPVGGLVNHSVHLFISGCLTLKLELSWKTVMVSVSPSSGLAPLVPLGASGEIGIVSNGTGCDATSVIVRAERARRGCVVLCESNDGGSEAAEQFE
jgi:hypothetical protein